MTPLQTFEFVFQFNLSVPDRTLWIYVLIALLAVIFGLGVLWGKFWNRAWSLGGHLGCLGIAIFFALLCAYSVFNLRGVSKVESWVKQQRTTLARSIAESGHFNRSTLKSAWTELSPSGGQAGLTPPDEAGNEIRLNNPEEAFKLAANAAEETRSLLRSRMPFVIGVPLATKSRSEIATETVDSIQFDASRFPIIVGASNEWNKTAATLQANYALDTSYSQLKPSLEDLKTASLWLLLLSLILPAVLIPMGAIKDIEVDPKG